MQHKTKGIVLSTINYNDKYMLVRIYTQSFGTTTYMVSKSRSKHTKVPRAIFTPLALVDMEVMHQASRDIHRIKEARSLVQLYSIPTNMSKAAMAFFISEFLGKTLKETDDTSLVYDFLYHSILILENSENSIANYHLVLLLKLSRIMGFYPNLEDYTEHAIFDMINGEFVSHQPLHNHFVNKEDSVALSRIARINYENMHKFKFGRRERNIIIDRMIEYYKLHLYDFPDMKSLDVLHELF